MPHSHSKDPDSGIGERHREKTPSGGEKNKHWGVQKRFHRVKYKQTFWGLEWPPLGSGYSAMAQNTQINKIYGSFDTEVNISTSNLSQEESKVSKVSKF